MTETTPNSLVCIELCRRHGTGCEIREQQWVTPEEAQRLFRTPMENGFFYRRAESAEERAVNERLAEWCDE